MLWQRMQQSTSALREAADRWREAVAALLRGASISLISLRAHFAAAFECGVEGVPGKGGAFDSDRVLAHPRKDLEVAQIRMLGCFAGLRNHRLELAKDRQRTLQSTAWVQIGRCPA